MLKKDELADPNSCLNRAKNDEYIFVLLARDPAAAQTIIDWIEERIYWGINKPNDPKILEALECVKAMKEQYAKIKGIQAV